MLVPTGDKSRKLMALLSKLKFRPFIQQPLKRALKNIFLYLMLDVNLVFYMTPPLVLASNGVNFLIKNKFTLLNNY